MPVPYEPDLPIETQEPVEDRNHCVARLAPRKQVNVVKKDTTGSENAVLGELAMPGVTKCERFL